MRYLVIISIALLVSACTSIPNAHLATRPERLTVERPIKLSYDPGAVRAATLFEIPAGTFTPVFENKTHVFYLGRSGEVRKSWIKWKPKQGACRQRPGGFVLHKATGIWWLFTLGDLNDLQEDGMPDLGLLFADKIDGKVINFCAQAGRSDENNQMVEIGKTWGSLDDYSAIRFEGSVPLATK